MPRELTPHCRQWKGSSLSRGIPLLLARDLLTTCITGGSLSCRAPFSFLTLFPARAMLLTWIKFASMEMFKRALELMSAFYLFLHVSEQLSAPLGLEHYLCRLLNNVNRGRERMLVHRSWLCGTVMSVQLEFIASHVCARGVLMICGLPFPPTLPSPRQVLVSLSYLPTATQSSVLVVDYIFVVTLFITCKRGFRPVFVSLSDCTVVISAHEPILMCQG